ncbi:hypothetical protein V6S67_07925 [Arthrobacter sp. Soc17.1.1.1]|uniref:hypothetical protein n=1 Tax=Arthrobacter sp. Soc17.1.1.1 TaxID=3121277 RepID=UPI002FE47A91
MTREISETVHRLPHLGGQTDEEGNPVLDGHGNEIAGWGAPEDVGIFVFDPGSSSEPREPGGSRVVVEPKIYGPFGMPFTHLDKVEARGGTYTVEGEPAKWRHPDGREVVSVVELRKVTG